jgi:CDGSH-type Zn-finger protein
MSGEARITPYRDGPILVRGPFTLTDQDGNEIATHQTTIALCRCGRSSRKPFCDGTHKATGWRAESAAQAGRDERHSESRPALLVDVTRDDDGALRDDR